MLILSLLSVLLLKSVAPSLAAAQLVFFILGFGLFWLVSRFPYEFLARWRWIAYGVLIFLLLIPLVFHSITRGIAGWIIIGNLFSIQPSQLAIPIVALVINDWFARFNLKDLAKVGLIIAGIALPGILILIEPDFGVFMIYAASLGSLLFVSKIPFKFLGGMLALVLVGGIVGWLFILKPYQKDRITSF